MIKVRDLTKKFGAFTAVDGVSFEVAAGETFALLGPNGSGKSTILKCLTGLIAPTSGEIIVDGKDAGPHDLGDEGRGIDDQPDQQGGELGLDDHAAGEVEALELGPAHTVGRAAEQPDHERDAEHHGDADAECRKRLAGLGLSPREESFWRIRPVSRHRPATGFARPWTEK